MKIAKDNFILQHVFSIYKKLSQTIKQMTFRLEKVLTIGFCLLWMIFIFIEYWYYHPSYALALKYFQYFDTLLILSIIGGASFWIIHKRTQYKLLTHFTNGLGIYLLFILISAVILWTHYYKLSQEVLGVVEGITYLGKISYISLATYLLLVANYALGDLFINGLFKISFKPSIARIIKLAIGITLFSFFFTILAFFDVLIFNVILPVLLIILGVRWKAVLSFAKATLVNPLIGKTNLNGIGFASLFLLLIFISLNFLANVRPYPFGFDALAVYLNLPNLLSQQGGLIEGYSPYYWSIFIALGQIIFDQLEVAIALSFGGGILSLFALYEISRKWVNSNFALLIVLIFYSLPLVNYQSFRDIKTDLGLLFILLAAFLVLMKWISLIDKNAFTQYVSIPSEEDDKQLATEQEDEKSTSSKSTKKDGLLAALLPASEQLIILLGILSGMALGIKLTSLIFIFAVLSVFSFLKGGTIGFLTNFILTIAIILIGELDTSLRAYHFGAANLKWIMLCLGLVGLGYMIYAQRKQFISLAKIVSIYLLLVAVIYAPWPIKNYQETGEVSIQTLIEGKPIGIPDD